MAATGGGPLDWGASDAAGAGTGPDRMTVSATSGSGVAGRVRTVDAGRSGASNATGRSGALDVSTGAGAGAGDDGWVSSRRGGRP